MLNKKSKKLSLAFPPKSTFPQLSSGGETSIPLRAMCLAEACHAVEEGSTQQDYRGKEKGSKHWLHCYMHSDSNNEA